MFGCGDDETPGDRILTIEILWEDLPMGRKDELRKSLSLHLQFFKGLQLKITNMLSALCCRGIFCYPSQATSGLAAKVMGLSFNVRAAGTNGFLRGET